MLKMVKCCALPVINDARLITWNAWYCVEMTNA